jgi:hypothetical protein
MHRRVCGNTLYPLSFTGSFTARAVADVPAGAIGMHRSTVSSSFAEREIECVHRFMSEWLSPCSPGTLRPVFFTTLV